MNATPEISRHAGLVAAACHRIQSSDSPPTLATLAQDAGMSPFHFQRVFKQLTGVTPKQFAIARRDESIRNRLPHAGTVTEAIYDAGFNSNARFYEKSGDLLGMAPATFRAGGKGEKIRFAVGECSLGSILVASSAKGVCSILLGDNPDGLARDLQDRFPKAELIGADGAYENWIAKVVGLVEMPRIGIDLPLDVRGTAFQQRVWRALREIPAGETATYQEIARAIGSPKAVRAVAAACGANAIAVAIPCHRVIRSDGRLSGYRWGVERKHALLAREASP